MTDLGDHALRSGSGRPAEGDGFWQGCSIVVAGDLGQFLGSARLTTRCWQCGHNSKVSRKRSDPATDNISTRNARHLSFFLIANCTSQPAQTHVGFAIPLPSLAPHVLSWHEIASSARCLFRGRCGPLYGIAKTYRLRDKATKLARRFSPVASHHVREMALAEKSAEERDLCDR